MKYDVSCHEVVHANKKKTSMVVQRRSIPSEEIQVFHFDSSVAATGAHARSTHGRPSPAQSSPDPLDGERGRRRGEGGGSTSSRL